MKHTPVTVSMDDAFKCEKWCQEMFGRSKPTNTKWADMTWFGRSIKDKKTRPAGAFWPPKYHYRFYFKDPEHAVLFKLKFETV